MEYTVQFKNNTNTLGIVRDISYTKKQICEEQFFNATSVAIWATYSGTKGVESEVCDSVLHNHDNWNQYDQ